MAVLNFQMNFSIGLTCMLILVSLEIIYAQNGRFNQFSGFGPRIRQDPMFQRQASAMSRNVMFGPPFRGRGPGPLAANPTQRGSPFGGSLVGQRSLDPRAGGLQFTRGLQRQRFMPTRQGVSQGARQPTQRFQSPFRPRDVVLREAHQPFHSATPIGQVPQFPPQSIQQQQQMSVFRGRLDPASVQQGFASRFTLTGRTIGHSPVVRSRHGSTGHSLATPRRSGVGQAATIRPVVRSRHGSTGHSLATPRRSGVGQAATIRRQGSATQRHVPQTHTTNQQRIFVRPIQRQPVPVIRHQRPSSHRHAATQLKVQNVQPRQKMLPSLPKETGGPHQTVSHISSAGSIESQVSEQAIVANAKTSVPSTVVVSNPHSSKSAEVLSVAKPDQTPVAVADTKGEPAVHFASAAVIDSTSTLVTNVSKPKYMEPTIEEDLQLIQVVLALLDAAGPQPAAAISQPAAQPAGFHQFSQMFPGMMGPWSSAHLQELMFGDTTDPPDIIPTTTAAPVTDVANVTVDVANVSVEVNVSASKASEPALNETAVTAAVESVTNEQIPAPKGDVTTPAPEIVDVFVTTEIPEIENIASTTESAASSEQPPADVTTHGPETIRVDANANAEITIDANAGKNAPKVPLTSGEQVIVPSLNAKGVDLVKIIKDALNAASFPTALQEKLLQKLSTVVSAANTNTESKQAVATVAADVKVSSESSMKSELTSIKHSSAQPDGRKVTKQEPVEMYVSTTEIPIDLSVRTDRLPTAADLGIVLKDIPIVKATESPKIRLNETPLEVKIRNKVLPLIKYITAKQNTNLPQVVEIKPIPSNEVTFDKKPVKSLLAQEKNVVVETKLPRAIKIKESPDIVLSQDKIAAPAKDTAVNVHVNKNQVSDTPTSKAIPKALNVFEDKHGISSVIMKNNLALTEYNVDSISLKDTKNTVNDVHVTLNEEPKAQNINTDVHVNENQVDDTLTKKVITEAIIVSEYKHSIPSAIVNENLAEPANNIQSTSVQDNTVTAKGVHVFDNEEPKTQNINTNGPYVEGIPIGNVNEESVIKENGAVKKAIYKEITAAAEAIASASGKPALEIVLENLAANSGQEVDFLSRAVQSVDPSVINKLTEVPKLSGVNAPEIKRKPVPQTHVPAAKETIQTSSLQKSENKSLATHPKAGLDINKSPLISKNSILKQIDLVSLAKELKLISNGTDIANYMSDPLFVSVLEDIVNQTLSGANTPKRNVKRKKREPPTTASYVTSTEMVFIVTTEEPPEIELEDITTTAKPKPTTTPKPKRIRKPRRQRGRKGRGKQRMVKG